MSGAVSPTARHAPRSGGSVALVTHAGLPQLSDDEQHLVRALAERGVRAVPAVWDDARVDWRAFDAVVVRSAWDYHLRFDDFRAWIDRLEAEGVPLWNPPAVLRWNADKTYLRDLAARGVRTVPTWWVEVGDGTPLSAILDGRGWADVVVKPAVSASGWETWRVTRDDVAELEPRFRATAARARLLVQPFVDEVARDGEWSLLFFGGRFSHAVLKRPRAGEFRVQSEYGGSADPARPPSSVLADAAAALRALPGGEEPLYARVDGCVLDGRLTVMELELLEPSAFLAADPHAGGRFADAIVERLERSARRVA